MHRPTAIGLLAVLILGGLSAYAADYDDSAEAWDTYLDLLIIDRMLEAHSKTGDPEPQRTEDWITLKQYSDGLPERFVDRLPQKDGWGRPFLVGTIRDSLTVLSRGEDGVADLVEGLRTRDPEWADFIPERERFGDDMFTYGREIVNAPRTATFRQRHTMADLRSVGTAVESYSIDNDLYPLQLDGLRGLETIREKLEPIYIRILPMTDAWGNPLLYWSDERHYVLVSPGEHGLLDPVWDLDPDAPWEIEFGGEEDHPDADIVFMDGQFVQWPRGGVR
jgi:hypothetical protein